MSISLDDAQAFLAEVASFSRDKVASKALHPEHPITPNDLTQLSIEALNLGLLPQTESEGFALWEHTESQGAMTFNIGFLQTLSEANTALAFAWHRQALAMTLLKASNSKINITNPLDISFLSTGHYGLGRMSFGRYLATEQEEQIASEDVAVLQDWLDPEQPSVLIAPAEWQSLVWPVWKNNSVRWQLVQREKLNVSVQRRQHGFDELAAFKVCGNKNNHRYLELSQPPKALAQQLLKQDIIGLLAIGAGSLKRVAQQTIEYTAIRKQGGHTIQSHPAVQQMLVEIQGALLQVENALQLCSRPLATIRLTDLLHYRMQLQPQLCHAASQAMQAHGGVGYMLDVGIEKGLREQNMLRMLAGGLLGIPLLLSALQESVV